MPTNTILPKNQAVNQSAVNQKDENLNWVKPLSIALILIGGIGVLAALTGGAAFGGTHHLWPVGSLSQLGQVNALIMMSAGGSGGFAFIAAGAICLKIKKCLEELKLRHSKEVTNLQNNLDKARTDHDSFAKQLTESKKQEINRIQSEHNQIIAGLKNQIQALEDQNLELGLVDQETQTDDKQDDVVTIEGLKTRIGELELENLQLRAAEYSRKIDNETSEGTEGGQPTSSLQDFKEKQVNSQLQRQNTEQVLEEHRYRLQLGNYKTQLELFMDLSILKSEVDQALQAKKTKNNLALSSISAMLDVLIHQGMPDPKSAYKKLMQELENVLGSKDYRNISAAQKKFVQALCRQIWIDPNQNVETQTAFAKYQVVFQNEKGEEEPIFCAHQTTLPVLGVITKGGFFTKTDKTSWSVSPTFRAHLEALKEKDEKELFCLHTSTDQDESAKAMRDLQKEYPNFSVLSQSLKKETWNQDVGSDKKTIEDLKDFLLLDIFDDGALPNQLASELQEKQAYLKQLKKLMSDVQNIFFADITNNQSLTIGQWQSFILLVYACQRLDLTRRFNVFASQSAGTDAAGERVHGTVEMLILKEMQGCRDEQDGMQEVPAICNILNSLNEDQKIRLKEWKLGKDWTLPAFREPSHTMEEPNINDLLGAEIAFHTQGVTVQDPQSLDFNFDANVAKAVTSSLKKYEKVDFKQTQNSDVERTEKTYLENGTFKKNEIQRQVDLEIQRSASKVKLADSEENSASYENVLEKIKQHPLINQDEASALKVLASFHQGSESDVQIAIRSVLGNSVNGMEACFKFAGKEPKEGDEKYGRYTLDLSSPEAITITIENVYALTENNGSQNCAADFKVVTQIVYTKEDEEIRAAGAYTWSIDRVYS